MKLREYLEYQNSLEEVVFVPFCEVSFDFIYRS
jgi:hypothetical protein